MKFNPEIHHRHSIRLKDFDYSTPGAYFITICTQNHENLFGEISNHEIILNPAGQMTTNILKQIPSHYPGNDIGEFIVMPNHIHAIFFVGIGQPQENDQPQEERAPTGGAPLQDQPKYRNDRLYKNLISVGVGPRAYPSNKHAYPFKLGNHGGIAPTLKSAHIPEISGNHGGIAPTILSLPDIVHHFKTMTTKQYSYGVRQLKWPPFNGKLWQRNYYEHIIRNENEFTQICKYIIENPSNSELNITFTGD
jgi:putative transposase